jgi:hypothetical protein
MLQVLAQYDDCIVNMGVADTNRSLCSNKMFGAWSAVRLGLSQRRNRETPYEQVGSNPNEHRWDHDSNCSPHE